MQNTYPIKIQAIRAKGQKPRLYLNVPMALAAAINLNPHDEVQPARALRRIPSQQPIPTAQMLHR